MARTRARRWALLTVLTMFFSLLAAGTAPAATADEDAQISFSLDRKRKSPSPLDGATIEGVIYPFLTGDDGVTAVRWWLDDPAMAGDPVRTDFTVPFDFSPGSVTHASAPFDTALQPDGEHTITAHVTTDTGVVVQHAVFVTENDVEALLTPSLTSVTLIATRGGPDPSTTVDLETTDGSIRDFTATSSEPWLTAEPADGSTPTQLLLTGSADLPVGDHTAEVLLESPDLPSETISVTLGVRPAPIEGYTVVYSQDAKRNGPVRLDGAAVSGDIYPLLAPESNVQSTTWWLDDPAMARDPLRADDAVAPYDLMPGSVRHRAEPLRTHTLPDGEHTITVLVTTTDGAQQAYTVTFETSNDANLLTWQEDSLVVEAEEDDGALAPSVDLSATDPGTVATLTSDAPWLTPATGTATLPATVELIIDPTGLAGGTHTARLTATASDAVSAILTVTLVVDAAPGLMVEPGALALTAVEDGPPVEASFTVTSSDGSALPVEITTSADWLTLNAATSVTPAQVTASAVPTGLAIGDHDAQVTVSSAGVPDVVIPVTLEIRDFSAPDLQIVTGTDFKRRNPSPLSGTTVSGEIFPFLSPDDGVSATSWWFNDPEMTGQPLRVDSTSPFDFTPGSVTHAAAPFDTATIPDGDHTITVEVLTADGIEHVIDATFTIFNDTNALVMDPATLAVQAEEGGAPESFTVDLTATSPDTAAVLETDTPWLQVSQTTATAPATLDVTVDPSALTPGVWHGHLVASAPDTFSAVLAVQLIVGDPGDCAPVACELIKVGTPYNLGFLYDSNNIIDSAGIGTGFTTLLPRPDGTEYKRGNLNVDLGEGTLGITGTPGSVKENTLDNALGVGFDGPSATTMLTATIAGPPPATGKYEQAGIWFGYDQDHVDRVALVHTPQGWRVEHVLEVGGAETARLTSDYLSISAGTPVELSLRIDPTTRQTTAYYKVGNAGLAPLRTFDVPGEFFSFDAAGIDPVIGTRSFGGVFAAQRGAASAPEFRFSQFSVTGERDPADMPDYPFDRYSHPVPFPTSMDFGPDGKLYVQSMFGTIHVLSFAPDGTVSDHEQVSTLGTRLALGLTVDPDSTPDDVILWAGHSSPSANQGEPDSGTLSRLSGPGLTERTDVVTGLPRSIANHGTNAIHFGSDGRLYLAQGGNTGAGAANTANTEFGPLGEQPLSGALLVADVKAPGFDGECAHASDIYQSGLDCDVEVFASGLRNMYDFVEHSNGHIYGPDNGLGVVGSFPPSPTAPCFGFGDTSSWTQGGNNPGSQNDVLHLLEEGNYYGHPNPTRDECVFKDGSFQGVDPLPNYQPPIDDLGPNRSANGTVEYTGDAFCGALDGNLLIGNYSVGDDIVAIELSEDGRSVVRSRTIVGGLSDPLPLTQAPDGRIVVGEFGSGGQVTFLTPRDIGCWNAAEPLPVQALDAGGAAVDDAMYVVAGKGPDGHTTRAFRYQAGSWSQVASVPGPGVENPAITTADGKVLVLGGSTGPFSGAVASAWSYDPATDAWSALPDMPTARGGATAQAISGYVYVAGGMLDDGASTAVVERLNLATGTWDTVAPLSVARDNPGSAVVDDMLYVFGGRTRLANGQTPTPTLGSVEAYEPDADTWTERAPLPTPRRTMAVGVIDGLVVLAGGEARPDGDPFDATELYDPATDEWTVLRRMPSGRHGTAAAVIDSRLHVVAGGEFAGATSSSLHTVLTLPEGNG